MKRTIGIVLALFLVGGLALYATGQQAKEGTTQPQKTKLVITWNEPYFNTSTSTTWPNEIAKQIFNDTGIEFSVDGIEDEKFKVLLAGGDLPDMLFIQNSSWVGQLIGGKQVIPLDDLVASNGKDILKNAPEMPALMKKYQSNGTGKLYFISPWSGKQVAPYNTICGYHVRWDLYKQLQYPKVATLDDFSNLLIEMKKLNPTTPDGKKVYAAGAHNEWWNYLWAYNMQQFREGWNATSAVGYTMNYKDSSLTNNYTNLDGPFWHTLEFLNKLDRLGLFDRDTFTMKEDEYSTKVKNGQYLSDFIGFYVANYNSLQVQADPNTTKIFLPLPIPGASTWDGYDFRAGKGKLWAITKNCKQPEAAMKLINYFFTSDGLRLVSTGVKGKQWDVIGGVPQLKPEYEKVMGDVETNNKIGIGWYNNWYGREPLSFVCVDGYNADLRQNDLMNKKRLQQTGNGAEKDYCAHYNAEFPSQVITNAVKSGVMLDMSKCYSDAAVLMPALPDNIKRIDAACDELAKKFAPKLIMASTDQEFSALQREFLKALKDAGNDASQSWWFDNFNKTLADFKKTIGK